MARLTGGWARASGWAMAASDSQTPCSGCMNFSNACSDTVCGPRKSWDVQWEGQRDHRGRWAKGGRDANASGCVVVGGGGMSGVC